VGLTVRFGQHASRPSGPTVRSAQHAAQIPGRIAPFHLAELKKVTEHFEAFKATALPAAELAGQGAAPPQPVKEKVEDDREFIGKRIPVSRLVARVADRMADGVTFGAKQVAAEVNRRYRDKLCRPIDARTASVTLRRLQAAGRLNLVRKGKSNHEALYTKPAFVRIRYFGLFANRHREQKVALCRSLLPGPPAPKLEAESWQARLQRLTGIDPLLCTVCGQLTMRCIEPLAPDRDRAPPPPL